MRFSSWKPQAVGWPAPEPISKENDKLMRSGMKNKQKKKETFVK